MKKSRFFAAIMMTTLIAVFLCSCTEQTENLTEVASDVEMETLWSKADLFEVPSEQTEETADGGEAFLSEIEKARKVYGLFIDTKPTLDESDSLQGADGVVYYRIADPMLDTAEEFNSYLLSYFSSEIVSSLLNVQMYVEGENGAMYAVDVGMSTDNVIDYKMDSFESDETIQTAVLTVSRDFDGDGKTDHSEELKFVREPVGIDGKWVFTKFSHF